MYRRSLKILLVDDDVELLELLKIRLETWGYEVSVAYDGKEAETKTDAVDPDIVISDVLMPGLSGMELLRCLKAGSPKRPIILITVQDSVDLAVEAMKQGAHDFLTKPLDYSKLECILESVQTDLQTRREAERLNSLLDKSSCLKRFVGNSKPMQKVYALIKSVAQTDASVLVTGESGTGKELVARCIHELSSRANQPFFAVNAAAIPETLIESELFGHEKGAFTGADSARPGCFEMANRGTLFLDEIAEMPVQLQSRLLRVLQDGRLRRVGGQQELFFDVRIIAATNQNPAQAIKVGKLREDLYFRLNVFAIHLPALRERKTDIHLLLHYFIHEFNQKHQTQVEAARERAIEALRQYSWPGNVRELRNIVERAVILAQKDWIEVSHLPAYVQEGRHQPSLNSKTMAQAEIELILKTLKEVGNKKSEAARVLGVDVKTIRNKLKSFTTSGGKV
jgi:two-component system, NtrC family, response regulator HydG